MYFLIIPGGSRRSRKGGHHEEIGALMGRGVYYSPERETHTLSVPTLPRIAIEAKGPKTRDQKYQKITVVYFGPAKARICGQRALSYTTLYSWAVFFCWLALLLPW